jgi:hypothetical protein
VVCVSEMYSCYLAPCQFHAMAVPRYLKSAADKRGRHGLTIQEHTECMCMQMEVIVARLPRAQVHLHCKLQSGARTPGASCTCHRHGNLELN